MKNLVTVATFNEAAKAQPLKQRLERQGVAVELSDSSNMERLWFVKKPLAAVRVKVGSQDYERARELVRQWDGEDVLRDAVHCPECKSPRVEYPQITRKFFIPNLVGLFANLGGAEKEFYCQDCQFTWPKEGSRPSAARPHMAPYYFIDGVEQTGPRSGATTEPHKQAA
jgi:hypothetical protein